MTRASADVEKFRFLPKLLKNLNHLQHDLLDPDGWLYPLVEQQMVSSGQTTQLKLK